MCLFVSLIVNGAACTRALWSSKEEAYLPPTLRQHYINFLLSPLLPSLFPFPSFSLPLLLLICSPSLPSSSLLPSLLPPLLLLSLSSFSPPLSPLPPLSLLPLRLSPLPPLSLPSSPDPCADNNGGCSHLCLLSATERAGYSCVCPDNVNPERCFGKSHLSIKYTATGSKVITWPCMQCSQCF